MDTEEPQLDPVTKKARRIWRKVEEECLIRCMRNEYSDMWSAENGFKTGFFTLMESEMRKILPESNIKAHPHIDSKVKVWKVTYNKITDLLRISGFSWNDVTKCIVVDDESVWEEYVKANKNAKGLNGKPFPFYDDWCILFGKDRATGELAEDPSQMADTSGPIDVELENGSEDVYIPFFGPEHGGGSSHGSTPPSSIPRSSTPPISSPRSSTPPGSTPRSSTLPGSTPRSSTPLVMTPPANAGVVKKGRKRSRFDDSIVESLETFCKSTSEHMGEMVKAMGYSKELSALRKRVPSEVEKLILDEQEKFKLTAMISQAEERVDTFFGTPDEKKQAWAEAVLMGLVYPMQ